MVLSYNWLGNLPFDYRIPQVPVCPYFFRFFSSLSVFLFLFHCILFSKTSTPMFVSSLHSGPDQSKPRLRYWTTRSSVCSFSRTAHLLCNTRFVRALYCAHSLTLSLTSLSPFLLGLYMIRWLFILCFFLFWPTMHWIVCVSLTALA